MRLLSTFLILTLSFSAYSAPMEFITFQPSSQYYDQATAQDWAQLAFYGGRVNVHTQPKVNYTIAKNLQSSDILALGNVVFGLEPAVGYTYFKGDGNTLEGTAKSLTTVDAIVDNLYIYGAKFPSTGGKAMTWDTFDVALAGGGKQSGTYLVIDTDEEAPSEVVCTVSELIRGEPPPFNRIIIDLDHHTIPPGSTLSPEIVAEKDLVAGGIYYDRRYIRDEYIVTQPSVEFTFTRFSAAEIPTFTFPFPGPYACPVFPTYVNGLLYDKLSTVQKNGVFLHGGPASHIGMTPLHNEINANPPALTNEEFDEICTYDFVHGEECRLIDMYIIYGDMAEYLQWQIACPKAHVKVTCN